jgi:hypothetical protein
MKHGDQPTLPRQAWDQKAQARLKNRRWCFGTVGSEAKLWAQASGSFEAVSLPGPSKNKVLSQQAVGFPVKWLRDDIMPVTQLGDAASWGDTNLSIRLGLPPLPADNSRGNGSRGNATASASPAAVFAGIHVQIPGTVRKRLLGAILY